jgi:hypothetical protein
MRDSRALTPLSLTEQQMQPLARLSHSVAVLEPEETVRGFSRSVVLPNSGRRDVGVRLDWVRSDDGKVERWCWWMVRSRLLLWMDGWILPTVQDDGDFLAVARCEDVVEEG